MKYQFPASQIHVVIHCVCTDRERGDQYALMKCWKTVTFVKVSQSQAIGAEFIKMIVFCMDK